MKYLKLLGVDFGDENITGEFIGHYFKTALKERDIYGDFVGDEILALLAELLLKTIFENAFRKPLNEEISR